MFFLYSLLIASSVNSELTHLKAENLSDEWFSEDKFHHFVHSAAISSGIYLAVNRLGKQEKDKSIYISFSITSLSGLVKEGYDKKTGQKHFSFKDLIYDIAGTITGLLMVSLED